MMTNWDFIYLLIIFVSRFQKQVKELTVHNIKPMEPEIRTALSPNRRNRYYSKILEKINHNKFLNNFYLHQFYTL